MSQYMYLSGSEDVAKGGYAMQSAAQEMMRAATVLEESANRLIQKMEEVTCRLEALAGKEGE